MPGTWMGIAGRLAVIRCGRGYAVGAVLAALAVPGGFGRLLAHGSVSCVARLLRVGIDRRAGAELARVQRSRYLESHHHVSIDIPALLREVRLDAFFEHPDHPLLVAGQPVVVGRPERHGVAV